MVLRARLKLRIESMDWWMKYHYDNLWRQLAARYLVASQEENTRLYDVCRVSVAVPAEVGFLSDSKSATLARVRD
jgi:hypothetical protein